LRTRDASRSRQKRIARERIERLLSLASLELDRNPERSSRYVHIARRISMRCKVRIPGRWRRMVCKRCETLLVPGKTSMVRLRESRIVVTCMSCGRVYRYPYGKKVT